MEIWKDIADYKGLYQISMARQKIEQEKREKNAESKEQEE